MIGITALKLVPFRWGLRSVCFDQGFCGLFLNKNLGCQGNN